MWPVRRAINTNCGRVSLNIFDALLKTKVTPFLETMCTVSDVFRDPGINSARTIMVPYSTMILFLLLDVFIVNSLLSHYVINVSNSNKKEFFY